jgi:hypothetical protein
MTFEKDTGNSITTIKETNSSCCIRAVGLEGRDGNKESPMRIR